MNYKLQQIIQWQKINKKGSSLLIQANIANGWQGCHLIPNDT